MTSKINGIGGLRRVIGANLGYSEWHYIGEERVRAFARATLGHDGVGRDGAEPEPSTDGTAPSYLILSLASWLVPEVFVVAGISMTVNYGLDRLRILSPVAVGSRVRVGASVLSVTDLVDATQVVIGLIFEAEGSHEPVCEAEMVLRYYTAAAGGKG